MLLLQKELMKDIINRANLQNIVRNILIPSFTVKITARHLFPEKVSMQTEVLIKRTLTVQ